MRLRSAGPAGKWRIDTSFYPVLTLALLLRATWALAVRVSPVSDSYVYDLLARHLAHGIGYFWSPGVPTAYWPVGTSFLYSLLYRVFGQSYTPIVVLNIALSLATIWMSMVLAERWFGRRVAIVAGYLLALWPMQIEFATVLASELIFNFLMIATLVVWESPWSGAQRAASSRPWLKAIVIGLLAAAICYIRPVGLLLPVILYAITIHRERRFAAPAAHAALAMLIMAAAIAPWSLRNTHLFGRFILISDNGGANLWMGNHPGGDGGTVPVPDDTLKMHEAERDAYLGNVAKAYIRAYPGRFVLRTLRKAVQLHSHETIGVHWNLPTLETVYGTHTVTALKLLSDLYWWLVLLPALGGVMLLVRQHGLITALAMPPIVLWAYFTALYAIIVIQDRYHFPCLPFIAMLAAVALCGDWRQFAHRRLQPRNP